MGTRTQCFTKNRVSGVIPWFSLQGGPEWNYPSLMKRNLLRCMLAGLLFPLAVSAAGVPPLTGAGCESFGFDFFQKLSATKPYQFASDANVAISPLERFHNSYSVLGMGKESLAVCG